MDVAPGHHAVPGTIWLGSRIGICFHHPVCRSHHYLLYFCRTPDCCWSDSRSRKRIIPECHEPFATQFFQVVILIPRFVGWMRTIIWSLQPLNIFPDSRS